MKKLLIVAPQCDGADVGENLCGFQWASRLSRRYDVTLLGLRFPGHVPPSEQLPGVRVVEWDAKPYLASHPRFNSAVKPWYLNYLVQARRWIAASLRRGEGFDLMHQIMPMATRYPSPCAGFDIPYVLGPVGGGVPTPPGFAAELGTEPRFMRLRNLDRLRLSHDPFLRRTYERAAAVICCSPYVADHLSDVPIRRIEIEYEVGIEDVAAPASETVREPGRLNLLYVGRVVRTKGLRDAIRALARLGDLPGVRLQAAGAGEDLEACRAEAIELGVADRVTFLGRLPRADLEPYYRAADALLFPSFREPTGGVLFEAMRYGMPVITAAAGGPGHIVTPECGITVPPRTPEQFAGELAGAIRVLAMDCERRQRMGAAARERIADLGLWDRKLARLARLYEDVAAPAKTRA